MTQANPWVAVDSMADRRHHALRLRRVWEAAHTGDSTPNGLRDVVRASWERSRRAGIDAERHLAPIVLDDREVEDRWQRHALAEVLPVLRGLLGPVTSDARHIMLITDAKGVLLWIEGHEAVMEATENMHCVRGADWSETGAGTNAMGTAIAVDHPIQIFSAEHFNRISHPWQCSGAPIHDPQTGETLGVVDLTGALVTAHPHTLCLVTAAARMAEALLLKKLNEKNERLRAAYIERIAAVANQGSALVTRTGRVLGSVPGEWLQGTIDPPPTAGEITLDDGSVAVAEPLVGEDAFVLWEQPAARDRPSKPQLKLRVLGQSCSSSLLGQPLKLTSRHSEILVLLALQPRGFTCEQLALELYGDAGKPVTMRAEMCRLRRLLGPWLQAQPYRLLARVHADFLRVDALVRDGATEAAIALYEGPLLPFSEVPLIVEMREQLEHALRTAVLESQDVELLLQWSETSSGRDDLEVAELLLTLLRLNDPRRGRVIARVQRLRRSQ